MWNVEEDEEANAENRDQEPSFKIYAYFHIVYSYTMLGMNEKADGFPHENSKK